MRHHITVPIYLLASMVVSLEVNPINWLALQSPMGFITYILGYLSVRLVLEMIKHIER